MSGHSKWSTIKHKKALKDQKRGKIFSQIVRQIQIAAKKDSNPETNAKLRMMVDKAKAVNMPASNIERAIQKGSGAGAGADLEEIILEAYGPEGSAFLIEAITDNRNRTVSEVKHLVEKNGGHMAEKGSVVWLFDKKIIFKIASSYWSDEFELALIDVGLEDSQKQGEDILLLFNPEAAEQARKTLKEKDIQLQEEEFDWQPKNPLQLYKEGLSKVEKLNEALEEHDDVKAVYTNLA